MRHKTLLGLLAMVLVLGGGGQGAAQSGASREAKGKICPELWPVTQGGKSGYIDNRGRLVIPLTFEEARDFSEGLAAVQLKGKWGYIDQSGTLVIPPRFVAAFPFSSGMALVVLRAASKGQVTMNHLGYIDPSGKVVIQLKEALDSKSLGVSADEMFFSEGLVPVTQDQKIGYMDKTGKLVIPPRFEEAGPFSEGLAAVKVAGKYGYIDRAGKLVIPPGFEEAGPFSEGLAAVRLPNNQEGYIDTSGRLVIKGGEFSDGSRFAEGLAAARGKNDQYGFIDQSGAWVIKPQFARVGDFSEGLAAVQKADAPWPGDLAYINKKGEIVIPSASTLPNLPPRRQGDLSLYRFCGGVARVSAGDPQDEDAEAYINREGKVIWPRSPEGGKK